MSETARRSVVEHLRDDHAGASLLSAQRDSAPPTPARVATPML
ncbi:MAG: hypothetical protein AAGG11_19950 [Pseudomonadota bacterium]